MRSVLNSDLRRALRRGAAAFLTLAVFAASGGASLVGRVCTHHGGADRAHGAAEPAAVVHGEHAHGAAHGPAAPAHADDLPAETHDDGACTCLGACQASAGAAAARDADVVRVPAPAEVVQRTVSVEPVHGASQSAWFLPPINGPPALT